jgi:polysaccharide pyruvyl transferase WcaK-like protein
MVRGFKIKVLVHGYFGYGNVGDETILSVLIDELRRVFNEALEIVVLSVNPKRTVRIHGVSAIREKLTSIRFWRHFLSSHILIFAGGGRYGYATWRRMAFLALLAGLLGKIVIFRSVGVYPYEWGGKPIISERAVGFKGLTGFFVRLALSKASHISVRDKYSYIVLMLTGVNRSIVIEQDLAFKLKQPNLTLCREIADKYGIYEGKILGVNLRTLDAETNERVVDYVANLIQDFIKKGFNKIAFIPFGFGSFEGRFFDNDLIIAYKLKEKLPSLIIIDKELNPKEVLCLFRYFDYIIAMRHHAVIFALLMSKPITALIYDTKTLEMLKMLGKNDVDIVLISDLK